MNLKTGKTSHLLNNDTLVKNSSNAWEEEKEEKLGHSKTHIQAINRITSKELDTISKEFRSSHMKEFKRFDKTGTFKQKPSYFEDDFQESEKPFAKYL